MSFPGLANGRPAISEAAFQRLAEHRHSLLSGFRSIASGAKWRLPAEIFTPGEAELASRPRVRAETPAEIARGLAILDRDPSDFDPESRERFFAKPQADRFLDKYR